MKKITILFGIIAIFMSCTYKTIKIEEDNTDPIDTTVVISFTNDILPILTDHDCVACHGTGAETPDLTAENAYLSLLDGGFVVANDPDASLFYTFPNPDGTNHRWEVYSNRQALTILTWINQGALNN